MTETVVKQINFSHGPEIHRPGVQPFVWSSHGKLQNEILEDLGGKIMKLLY